MLSSSRCARSSAAGARPSQPNRIAWNERRQGDRETGRQNSASAPCLPVRLARFGVGCLMFTGLVECLGTVRALTGAGAGRELVVKAPFAAKLVLGESVAVNGVCLTVVEHDAESFRFQLAPETLIRTNLGQLN